MDLTFFEKIVQLITYQIYVSEAYKKIRLKPHPIIQNGKPQFYIKINENDQASLTWSQKSNRFYLIEHTCFKE